MDSALQVLEILAKGIGEKSEKNKGIDSPPRRAPRWGGSRSEGERIPSERISCLGGRRWGTRIQKRVFPLAKIAKNAENRMSDARCVV
jgi:hypothetical protein